MSDRSNGCNIRLMLLFLGDPESGLPRILENLESHGIRLKNVRPGKTGVSKKSLKVMEFENS